MLHGDVIIGTSTYDQLDHELGAASYADLCGYRSARQRRPTADDSFGWSADGNEEFAAQQPRPQYEDVTSRPDTDVRGDVLRALRLDSLVPLTVDAKVSDGVVTLTGTVGSEREWQGAAYLAGCVPGVVGILDDLARRPASRSEDDEAAREAVAAALARTEVADVAGLTVDTSGWSTVVLSGAVQSRSDHGLAIATALSVAGVETVDDCIQVECD
jgi:osmotically-inducible protein OsmY